MPCCELAAVEREEVRALPALDVEDLDVLALAHLVGSAVAASTRRSSRGSASGSGSSTSAAVRGIALRTSTWRSLGGTSPSTTRPPARRRRGPRRAGRGSLPPRPVASRSEQPGAFRVGRRQAALAQHRRGRVGRRAQRARVGRALGREHRELGDLAAVGVAERDAVVAPDRHDRRAARSHPEDLEARVERLEPSGGTWRRPCDQARAAVVLLSSSAACAMSCSASSRLAAGSSFLTSFSTARRLYVWFQ